MAGGRPKGSLNKATKEIRTIARPYAPSAVKELARIMAKSDSDQARVAAIKELLDRGYGKSPATMAGEDGEGPAELVIKWLSANS